MKRNPHTDSFFCCKQKRYFESLSFLNRISSQTFAMKHFLFLLSILAGTLSYAQESIHFLFTTEGNYQISEPLCTGMIEESEHVMKNELMKIKQLKKSGEYNIKNAGLKEVANYELIQKLAENPKDYFPIYSPMIDIFRQFDDLFKDNVFISLQEVALKELDKPNIQIGIRNVVVSSSTTSLNMDIIDLSQEGAPKVSKHFSCATGRILEPQQDEALWFFFWQRFYDEVAYQEWLLDELYKMNPKLISEKQRNEMIEAKLSELGIGSESFVKERVGILQKKLIGFPISGLNLDEAKGILMSQDQNKFVLYTQQRLEDEYWIGADDDSEIQQVKLTKIQINAEGEIQCAQLSENIFYSVDRLSYYRNRFYYNSLTPFPTLAYNEAQWLSTFFDSENLYDNEPNIILKHESQSKETSQLLKTYIEPLLNELANDSSQYNNYYQRITADNINEYNFDVETKPTVVKDYLLSNPEKTAFIYPVLLQHGIAQDRENYYTQEDFKFYVLIKNEQGTFDLYDWHYFSALPYKDYYSLLACAYSHLKKISNWDGESEVIYDEAFWNNFVLKKCDRGFDYLTMLTTKEQSPVVSRSAFEAQVKDCYKLLSEQDVVDFYPNQLQQMILCLNTIQTYNLKGKDELQLLSLANQLHFQKRLNKVQKFYGHYYPFLNVEYGGRLLPHSYYQLQ